MPAISFQRQFLDALLLGTKQQTTRKQTDRIKVGDICNIYIEQRRRIRDKPLRRMTHIGVDRMYVRGYPMIPEFHQAMYHAHFLGKVEIAKVYLFCPVEMATFELEEWAQADGFKDPNLGFTDFEIADTWFRSRYGDDWMRKTWTVIKWDGWKERYFEADDAQQ